MPGAQRERRKETQRDYVGLHSTISRNVRNALITAFASALSTMHQWMNCDSVLIIDKKMPPRKFAGRYGARPETSRSKVTNEGYAGLYYFHTPATDLESQDKLIGRYHREIGTEPAIEAAIDKMRLRANPPGFVLGKSRAEQWQPRHPHYDGPRPLSRIGSAGEKLFAPSTSDVILRDNSVSATTNARQNFLTLMAKPPPTAQVYHRVPSEAEKKHKLAQAGRSMATTQYRPRSSSTNVGRGGGGSKDAQIASLRAQLASARSQRR
jgi:hypothetical protein